MRHDNDFVIVKLNEPLELNENVQPACLPPSNYLPEDSTENTCYTSGWGNTEYGTVQLLYISTGVKFYLSNKNSAFEHLA